MPRHLAVLFISTFVLGLFVGFLVFIGTKSSPSNVPVPAPVVEDPNSFEVLGYTYGGCENTGCTSYRLESDGSYTYILRGLNGGDQRFTDKISAKQLADLADQVHTTDLATIASSTFSGTCPTTYNANAYRYELRVGNDRYSIDSCKESIDGNAFFNALANYFEVFSALYRNK